MKPATPDPVKLFIGVLYHEERSFEQALAAVQQEFGRMDFKSKAFEFTCTDYYRDELGWPIHRRFLSVAELTDPGELVCAKLTTNRIEDRLASAGKRTVNLDPGYMDYNKVVLASAKYNGQKIYLGRGIYADPTLWYERGTFVPYPFSFPDFKSKTYDETFLHIRALYKGQARKLKRAGQERP